MLKLGMWGLALVVLAGALPLYAQGGCVDSPENPTALLALVGLAGACYSPAKNKLLSVWHKRQNR